MTIKLLLLKSGEDLIADVQEMVVKENVVGYFLNKPCVVKMRDHKEVVDEEVTEEKQKSQFQVKFYPWIPLAKDSVIPLTIDWVNPDKLWPDLSALFMIVEESNQKLMSRLPVYPDFIDKDWLSPEMYERVINVVDKNGYTEFTTMESI